MRQSPQPVRLVVVLVSVGGVEILDAPTIVLAVARFPCVCAASTVVP